MTKKRNEFAKELYKALALIKATGANIHEINQIRSILARCAEEDEDCSHCEDCLVDRMFLRALPYLKGDR